MLLLLGPAAEQDDDGFAIFAEIHSVAGTEIDPVFKNRPQLGRGVEEVTSIRYRSTCYLAVAAAVGSNNMLRMVLACD